MKASTPLPITASDADLLAHIAAKDRPAFEQLYHRYHRRLAGYLCRWLKKPEMVEEVLNDVMFAVWTQAGQFAGRSRVSTWIFGIAYRQAMKAVSRASRHAQTSEEGLEEATAKGLTAQRDLRLSLEKVLRVLSPEHRTVVELTYFEDCSYQEIADIVRCPVNTVKTRMFYARKHLRQVLPRFGLTSPGLD